MSDQAIVGVIGGSGLYRMDGLEVLGEERIDTPFGEPSDSYLIGKLGGQKVIFLPRHGRGHRFTPSEVNYRANIYGMKKLGVTHIISVSAVGSMKEEIEPGHFVVPHQFLDRTKNRPSTFFGQGIVGHVPFGDPVCLKLADVLAESAKALDIPTHIGGTYLCMEGPQYSTRAESLVYRGWGVSVIGMTNLPEAKLAREAEICYATIALATDYDCWHESEEQVTSDMVMETFKKNVGNAKQVLQRAVPAVAAERPCTCPEALKHAIVTDPKLIPGEARERLDIILGKYLR